MPRRLSNIAKSVAGGLSPPCISAPFIEALPAARQVKRDEVGGRCQAPKRPHRTGLAGDDRRARAIALLLT
jgi:hypothetical protein